MIRDAFIGLPLGCLCLAGLILLLAGPARAVALEPGVPFTGRLSDGDSLTLPVELAAGTYARFEFEPRDVDLALVLRGPDGSELAAVESPAGRPGPRHTAVLAPHDGIYELEVRATRQDVADGGELILRLAARRPAGDGDRQRAWAARALAEGFRLSESRENAADEAALERFRDMLELYRGLGDPAGEAAALYWIGLVLHDLRRFDESLASLERARQIWRELGRREREAEMLYRLGIAGRESGRLASAAAFFESALELWRSTGERRQQALALSNLAAVERQRHRLQLALERSHSARRLFAELGASSNEARELLNMAAILQWLGESERSVRYEARALALLRRAGDRRGEAHALNDMGWQRGKRGAPRSALEYFEAALALAVEHGFTGWQAIFLDNAGRAWLDLGEPRRALLNFERAFEIDRRHGGPRSQVVRRVSLGMAWRELGDCDRAADWLGAALELARRHGYRRDEAEALYENARTLRASGRLDEALLDVEAALAIIERARTDLAGHRLRSSYTAFESAYYELRIDLLMQLALGRPGAGHAERALAAREAARGRGLLEILAAAGTELRDAAPAPLLAAERRLHEQLNQKALLRSQLLAEGGPRRIARLDEEIRRLLGQLDELDERLRAAAPGFAELARPRPPSVADLQEELLEDGSLLLEYALGEERSFLFVLDRESLKAHVLPPRPVIETAARRAFELLSDGAAWRGSESFEHGRRYHQAATLLSDLVLAPAAHRLAGQRLLVVSDGALEYLPFAALPAPGSGHPLVLEHEIVHLPSASIVAFLRRARAARPPPRFLLAVADPVYAAASRLPASRREAETIAALARAARPVEQEGNDGGVSLLLGHAADRRHVVAAAGDFRLLHFAVHGVLDSRHPELSGLALSALDRDGRPQDGFLRLYDIINLRLSTELVVLSACDTALGEELRGEGLSGLVRGFLHAGARRVMASLWRVEDAATAVLMESFYRALLSDGLPPAAALRQAQIEMLDQAQPRRWRTPHHWAAFVVQGEWR